MTLDKSAINFRLMNLLNSSTTSSYKNNEKELLSIIKVLEELNKEKKRIQRTNSSQNTLGKIDVEEILEDIQKEINNSADKERLKDSLKKNGRI
jgi:hypothetical protein